MTADKSVDDRLASNDPILIDDSAQQTDQLLNHARQLVRTLDDGLVDDRYLASDSLKDGNAAAIVGRKDLIPLAFVNGSADGGKLHLDVLANESNVYSDGEIVAAAELLVKQVVKQSESDVTEIVAWTRPDGGRAAAAVSSVGFRPVRSLHQLRMPLPAAESPAETRAFRPTHDVSELIRVNNRAFAQHPDQGSQTEQTIAATMGEPWFDPTGLRVLNDPNVTGKMAGFCWTKVHPPGNYLPTSHAESPTNRPADDRRRVGEIYVIGLDPDYHGQGLGIPLVAAGLQWLAEQDLSEVLLYVESDNDPALRTYERLGFHLNRIDTAWHLITTESTE